MIRSKKSSKIISKKVNSNTKKSKSDTLHKIELWSSLSLIVVLMGILVINNTDLTNGSNSITGMVPTDVLTQDVNLQFSESQTFDLESDSFFTATSLRLSGTVQGEGLVRVLLEDSSGQRYLVYSNLVEKSSGNLITGAVTDNSITLTPTSQLVENFDQTIPDGYKQVSGPFYNECQESCFISVLFSKQLANRLIFQIGNDTTLNIKSISYTIS